MIDNNNSHLTKVQKEIEEVASSTFCVLPWIHLATRPNGDMRLCCTANISGAGTDHQIGLVKNSDGKPVNFAKERPLAAFNNQFMKDVRKTMLAGKIPASCKGCYDEESHGLISKRIWETAHWKNDENLDLQELVLHTQEDGTVPNKLYYLDLRLGNTCNIKCIMCSPHDSSKWVNDWKQLLPQLENKTVKEQMSWNKTEFNNFWYKKGHFWKEIYDQIPNLKQVYFAGGEPLMIDEHKLFIKEIIKQGYQDRILLRYNSNGILVDNELIDLWSQFRKVKFAVSIDACFERDEYIRYPTKFSEVEKTLQLLDNTPDNIQVSIATAIQIFNIKHMPDFLKWKIEKNFKKINMDKVYGHIVGGGLINVHLVHIPTFLNITILPKEDKEEIVEKFNNLKTWLYKNYTTTEDFWKINPTGWNKWEGILSHMNSQDNSHLLSGFKEYVTKLDKIRNLNSKKIFPELSHLL